MGLPIIIQGGMGAGVSSWPLAKAVSRTGQLGVISGTALDAIIARRLQMGDPEGHLRRALDHFPSPDMAGRILDAFFVSGGKSETDSFKSSPVLRQNPGQMLTELTVVANFAEVFLAKEGHSHPVGINLLEKIQLANLHAIYGAMLADVDYVIMGAGIPREIPGVLDKLAGHEKVSLKISVHGATAKDDFRIHFDPVAFFSRQLPGLKRPGFLGIISSVTLGLLLAKKSTGKVDGFIIEGPSAGGHNAPPRGKLTLNQKGEPVYSRRDEADIKKICALGLPFWLAGSYGSPEKLNEALSLGASGVQVGTAFAFTKESGFSESIKRKAIQKIIQDTAEVFTDPLASPTGFPFKVLNLEGTLSEEAEYRRRPRVCNQGYLRHMYKRPDGSIGYRCPAEPVEAYVKKGGHLEDTKGRKCLCNGLLTNLDLAQQYKNGYMEKPLVTIGDDILSLSRFLRNGNVFYSVNEVIESLLTRVHP